MTQPVAIVDPAVFNVGQFDREFLRPIAEEFAKGSAPHWKTLRFSELVAGYFWLELGTDLDYFGRDEAIAVARHRLSRFLADFEQEFTSHGYMFDPHFEAILKKFLSAKSLQPMAGRLDPVQASLPTRSAFRSALTYEVCLVRDSAAESIIATLNFAPHLLEDVILRDHALEFPGQRVLSRSTIVSGVVAVMEYMENLVNLSGRVLIDTGVPEDQRGSLERKIRQITRWRVNRFRSGVDDEFLRVAKFVSGEIDVDWTILEPRFKNLLHAWSFTHTKSITGTA